MSDPDIRLIEQSFEVLDWGASTGEEILRKIEQAGRTCYLSQDKITPLSSAKFCQKLLTSGHHSVLEHHNITARMITNRGVMAELTRHRLASYSIRSTRYVNYQNQPMEFIWPVWCLNQNPTILFSACNVFRSACLSAAIYYQDLLSIGWRPEQAREVLPNALATEIVMTANLREWLHVFKLRCSKAAHPQIRALMFSGLQQFKDFLPTIFDALWRDLSLRDEGII